MARRDPHTLDLYRDYEPEAVVERFEPADQVQAYSRAGKLSKAVARTLTDHGRDREGIAQAMTEFLGEGVSRQVLDKYASQAAEHHSIPALRLVALVAVTRDVRLLNSLLEELDLIVVPRRYEALLRREQARIAKEKFEREEQAADAEWRARR